MTRQVRTPLCAKLLAGLFGLLLLMPVQAQQMLQVGRTDLNSPLSDIAQRVVTEALQRCGMSAQFNAMPLQRSIALVNEGALDGDLMRITDAAKQFPNLVSVPTPLAMVYVALYGRDAGQVNLPRADIAKLKVGLPRAILLLVKNSAVMDVTDSQTNFKALDMMLHDRFDIAMMVHIDAELEIAKNNFTGIARRSNYWAAEPLYFFLNKKHQALVPKINAALQEMQAEGLISKYYDEGIRKINVKSLKPVS